LNGARVQGRRDKERGTRDIIEIEIEIEIEIVSESESESESVVELEMRGAYAGEVTPVVAELLEAEATLRSAQLAADTALLDALLEDDLLFTGPDGQLATKAQDIEAHRSGVVRFREHHPEELRMRMVGDAAAITALRTRIVVDVAGQTRRETVRYTRMWRKSRSGEWRVAGGHVSIVASDDNPPA